MGKTSESKQSGAGIAVSVRLTWSGTAGRSTAFCIAFRRLDVAFCRLLSCPWPDQKSWRCTAQIVLLMLSAQRGLALAERRSFYASCGGRQRHGKEHRIDEYCCIDTSYRAQAERRGGAQCRAYSTQGEGLALNGGVSVSVLGTLSRLSQIVPCTQRLVLSTSPPPPLPELLAGLSLDLTKGNARELLLRRNLYM